MMAMKVRAMSQFFHFSFGQHMVLSRDSAHCETIVLAWPQMCSVCHGGDAAKGWRCALKILYNNNTREHGKHGRELYNE